MFKESWRWFTLKQQLIEWSLFHFRLFKTLNYLFFSWINDHEVINELHKSRNNVKVLKIWCCLVFPTQEMRVLSDVEQRTVEIQNPVTWYYKYLNEIKERSRPRNDKLIKKWKGPPSFCSKHIHIHTYVRVRLLAQNS